MRGVDLLAGIVRAGLIDDALVALEGRADRAADVMQRAGQVEGGRRRALLPARQVAHVEGEALRPGHLVAADGEASERLLALEGDVVGLQQVVDRVGAGPL